MSYTKHNYKKGDELLASQLNEMDDQIELNEQTADILVTVSNTQPAAAKNRVWVKATPSEIEIPTMDDHNELSRHLNDLTDTVSTTQIVNTVSGAIASFEDGANGQPIQKLVAQIEPVQDLHGCDHPWPAGGGKNKACDIFSQYTKPDNYYILPVDLSASSTWQFHATQVGSKISGLVFGIVRDGDRYSNFVGMAAVVNSDGDTFSLNVNVDSSFVSPKLVCYCSGETQFNQIFANYHIQLESGSTATAWTPYENLCPISGHTGAEISDAAMNIWDEEWEVGQYNSTTGEKADNSNNIRSKNFISCKPNTTYSFVWDGWTAWAEQILFYDANHNFLNKKKSFGSLPSTFTTPANASYMTFFVGGLSAYNHDISINYPATDTEYHPYTGNQISVTFPSSAGTVYGGALTINPDRTGELTVDRNVVQIPAEYWVYNSSVAMFGARRGIAPVLANLADSIVGGYDVVCSAYKHFDGTRYANIVNGEFSVCLYNYSSQDPYVIVKDTRFTSIEDFKANSGIENVSFEIPLATPQTYQLTSEQVSGILTTLYGTNNIWANTGDTEVTYPADTKLYIDNKITQAIANALNS